MVNPIPFADTFKGKRVFITGHTGFKGTWLLLWLHKLGAVVKGYSLLPDTELNLYGAVDGDSLCESVIADIRDAARLSAEIADFGPDFIFHLAAQALVRTSYAAPVDTVTINAVGTINLLEAVRKLDKPCVTVIITTDKVYHNLEKVYAYREEDALGGYDPYSASKACAEILVSSWRASFLNPSAIDSHGQSVATARAGNVIGGGDWSEDRIIPDIIRALSAGRPVSLRNPSAVRPWQHVLESLSGYLTLAACQAAQPGRYEGAYNFGPGASDNKTVQELAQTAVTAWGSGTIIQEAEADAPHEATLLMLDNTKAVETLGWNPVMAAPEAISLTIAWYRKAMAAPGDARTITLEQISLYETALLAAGSARHTES